MKEDKYAIYIDDSADGYDFSGETKEEREKREAVTAMLVKKARKQRK